MLTLTFRDRLKHAQTGFGSFCDMKRTSSRFVELSGWISLKVNVHTLSEGKSKANNREVTLIFVRGGAKTRPSADFTHKAIIKYITHVHISAQFFQSLLDFWHNQLKHTDQYALLT